MNDLALIVPSRGRPQNARRLTEVVRQTAICTDLYFGFDCDDRTVDEQLMLDLLPNAISACGPRLGMCGTLNTLASRHAERYRYIGFMGDDHLPRTVGWDFHIAEALTELGSGIVYGNDLFQGERLPTAWFVTSDIVRALGWMAPPRQRHLYLDDAVLALGRAAGCIRYLPDVIIEHMHPAAHKADMDDGYAEVNSDAMYDHDRKAFDAWLADGFAADVEKIKRLRQAA